MRIQTAIIVAGVSLGLAVGCQNANQAASTNVDELVIDDLGYLSRGAQLVNAFLATPEGSFGNEEADKLVMPVVQIEVRTNVSGGFFDSSFDSTWGSGVLMQGARRVLTAGHLFDDLPGAAEIVVYSQDGRTAEATLTESTFERFKANAVDYAVLEFEGFAGQEGLPAASVQGDKGEFFLAAGYPAGLGLRVGGFVGGRTDRPTPLQPLRVVLVRQANSESAYKLVAGSVPLGGMSGAPIFDRSGACVGLISRVSTSYSEDGRSTQRIGASSLGAGWPWSNDSRAAGE